MSFPSPSTSPSPLRLPLAVLTRHLPALCLALAGLVATGAQAQTAAKTAEPGFYGEIGYSALTWKDPGVTLRPKQIRLIGGYELHPNLAIEGLLGLHAGDASFDILGVQGNLKVDHVLGLYLKPKFAVTPEFDLFARVGYARTKVSISAPLVGAASDSASDFSYGVGAAYNISDKMFISLDYMSYYDKDDVRIKGATLGLGMRF